MKKLLLSLNLIFTFIAAFSQSWSELGGLNALAATDTIENICTYKTGYLYAAGNFTNSNGNAYVAKWNGSNWSELGGINALAANAGILAICTDTAGNVFAGGRFANSGSKKYVAKWNGSSWSEVGGLNALSANKAIFSIFVNIITGNLFAAGNFKNSSGNSYVAKWDGSSWSELGGLNGLSANNVIFSTCYDQSGNVYAAGDFTNASGGRYVAKWNGTTWSELGGLNALAASDTIFSICTDASGNVYAAGKFLNGNGNKYVAKWNGSSWNELGGLNALAANKGIHTVFTDSSGNLYAAGNFTNSYGYAYVAKWNGISWSELGGLDALSANSQIRTIAVDKGNNVYAAGAFTNSSGNKFVAKYTAPVDSLKMGITVNGLANGAVISQGADINWVISNIPAGGTVNNQLWIDINKNGVIDPGIDLLFVAFNETDGQNNTNGGPGDLDGLINDTIHTSLGGLYFPVDNYIFYSLSTTGSSTSAFSITAMSSPTYSVSGKVTKSGVGQSNVVVRVTLANSNGGGKNEFYALTDTAGNYIVETNLPTGTAIDVQVPTGDGNFNSSLGNMIISPLQDTFTLTSNVTGINFVLSKGRVVTGIVTDTLLNPIPNVKVGIFPTNNGGNGYSSTTDITGRYYIAVDTGRFSVQFGDQQTPQGYLVTYYNQQYIQYLSTGIQVTTSSPDTINNINAILKRGALITGTFLNNGIPATGNISAFAYNTSGNPLYQSWVDSTQSQYYLIVPPGNYTIGFSLQGNNSQVYYNQTYSWPGTAVTINSLNDTIRNINVDFAFVPLPTTYSFYGRGNWSQPFNWQNNMIPDSTLPAGDTIIINGPQCILDKTQTISPGAVMIISQGSNLVIPGALKLNN